MKLCMGCMEQVEDDVTTCPYCGFNEITLRQESYYLDPGTVVGGRYIVGRVQSYGGHTVSYLGMDAAENRKVVVKEYLPSDFSTRSEGEKDVTIYSGDGQEQFEQGLSNFLNEANRIEHLQDAEGIAKVYDCLTENETGYVISEYVRGRTLKEILQEGRKYNAEEAAEFIGKILRGLSGVHDMDIVHCDISPETIIVTDDGNIKLMDFGATRYVTTANSKSLAIILKRGYAPEEQYRSKGKRGPWTDVYALGAVMYQMITGAAPQESVERALSDELKEPSKMGIAISNDKENALMNALNVYQENRTPSAGAFLKELTGSNVKRIKVKQKKNKVGKFPLWAKGLVACLACVVIAGGAFMFQRMAGSSPDSLGDEAVIMPDLRGKTREEAEASIKELKEKYGWEITFKSDEDQFVFDLKQEDGTVCTQSVSSGTELYNPDSKRRNEEIEGGLIRDEKGKPKGSITFTFYSTQKLHYREISNLNAFALAKKLDFTLSSDKKFKKKNPDKDYYELDYIKIGERKFSKEELENEENKDQEIPYSNDIEIYYYASEFFYWKKLPDFMSYGSIGSKELAELDVYEYVNEKEFEKKKGKTKSLGDSSLVDNKYAAFAAGGYEPGQIVGQTVEAGEEYNQAQPGETSLKIKVVGTVFSFEGKTGSAFMNEVKAHPEWDGTVKYGFTPDSGGKVSESEGGGWQIATVQAYELNSAGTGADESKPLEYFKLGQGDGPGVFLNIIVKKPVVKQKPEQSKPKGNTTPSNKPTQPPPEPSQPTPEPSQPTPDPTPEPTTPPQEQIPPGGVRDGSKSVSD